MKLSSSNFFFFLSLPISFALSSPPLLIRPILCFFFKERSLYRTGIISGHFGNTRFSAAITQNSQHAIPKSTEIFKYWLKQLIHNRQILMLQAVVVWTPAPANMINTSITGEVGGRCICLTNKISFAFTALNFSI